MRYNYIYLLFYYLDDTYNIRVAKFGQKDGGLIALALTFSEMSGHDIHLLAEQTSYHRSLSRGTFNFNSDV